MIPEGRTWHGRAPHVKEPRGLAGRVGPEQAARVSSNSVQTKTVRGSAVMETIHRRGRTCQGGAGRHGSLPHQSTPSSPVARFTPNMLLWVGIGRGSRPQRVIATVGSPGGQRHAGA